MKLSVCFPSIFFFFTLISHFHLFCHKNVPIWALLISCNLYIFKCPIQVSTMSFLSIPIMFLILFIFCSLYLSCHLCAFWTFSSFMSFLVPLICFSICGPLHLCPSTLHFPGYFGPSVLLSKNLIILEITLPWLLSFFIVTCSIQFYLFNVSFDTIPALALSLIHIWRCRRRG